MTARLVAALVVALPLPAAAQETVVTLEAPRPVRTLLDRLQHADPAVRAGAAAALGADDRNAPFLRFERVAALTPAHRAALDAALAPIEARAWPRHAERVKAWAKERRLDLLCEYLAGCPEAAVSDALDLVLPVQQAVHAEAFPADDKHDRPAGFIPAKSLVGAWREFALNPADAGLTVEPGTTDMADGWTFDGRRALLARGKIRYGYGAVVASRGRLALTNPKAAPGWSSSVVLSNGPAELLYARAALVVVDGDVEFRDGARLGSSVVVTTGSVVSPAADERVPQVSLTGCRLHAGGSVELRGGSAYEKTRIQAGGTVNILRPGAGLRDAAEGATLVPYGIRFVAPADFGARIEAKDRGMVVTAVEAWSPLARYGVRAGDVVTHVGSENTRTPDDLRRALRRGVIEESAVFHLRRGGERLTRVVYLDGIPARR